MANLVKKPKSVVQKPKVVIGGHIVPAYTPLKNISKIAKIFGITKLATRKPKTYGVAVSSASATNFIALWEYDVTSSNLEKIAYDAQHEMLKITFRSGWEYVYWDVPIKEFADLARASSHGVYFWRHIRNNYRYKRIA